MTNVAVFDDDVAQHGGYRYSSGARLSCRLANQRLTDALLSVADLAGQSVLDIGCGDGTYTVELFDRARPAQLEGLDAAPRAIEAAHRRAAPRPLRFRVGSAYELPYPADAFDWACLRGVLHHLDRPAAALSEALRVARRVVVVEPNGYSPILKLLECVSPYHVAHGERSFRAGTLRRWVRQQGGRVGAELFAGLVPMFAPDWVARWAKTVEPVVERTPLLRVVGCAVYVFVAERREKR